ncbi:unnamed protein product [Allacma fusca]|uniref:Uncharacterized protein n=1 Tax=Allacma fusca TaxID=39272 RepID=A0A8J2P1U0_9HEXA|nr:unnamed protein product [Allacma fusca]
MYARLFPYGSKSTAGHVYESGAVTLAKRSVGPCGIEIIFFGTSCGAEKDKLAHRTGGAVHCRNLDDVNEFNVWHWHGMKVDGWLNCVKEVSKRIRLVKAASRARGQ